MARTIDQAGAPQPGKAGRNYGHIYSPKSAGVDKAYGSRGKAKTRAGSATSAPPAPGSSGGKKPHHYGERAHTTIKALPQPGAAAKRSNSSTGGRGPHH
jgi:hypothetical protein